MIIAAADAQRVHQAERAIEQSLMRLRRCQRDYELTSDAAMITDETTHHDIVSLMRVSVAAIYMLVG
ncbi:macrolide ABC transporter permease/ATP-binding protein MacB, partial [Pseudomonas aeruginosa]|nr:macrolide ABC transporter permease/ATP-binding protein MacB [Pseudomonas aeruginosa]